MNAGTLISQLEESKTLPLNSSYIVDMGDGSGTKRVTQETLNEEIKEKVIDILDSEEEIDANTDEGKIAGAIAVKEVLNQTRKKISDVSARFGNYLEKSYIFGGRAYASRDQGQPRLAGRFISLPAQFANTDINNYFVSISIQGEADTILDYFTQKITGGFNIFFRYRDGHNFEEQYAVWFDYTVLINH